MSIDDLFLSLGTVELREVRHRIGAYHANVGGDLLPLLHDRVASVACDVDPSLGVYGTMNALATWYHAVGRVLGGEPVKGLPGPMTLRSMLGRNRGVVFDRVLRRSADFAGGFMVGLTGHGFGPAPGPSAIGHAGWMGTSWGFVDPDRAVAGAVLLNLLPVDQQDADHARARIMRSVYDDVEGSNARA